MNTKKIICVWIGSHPSEQKFYQEYLQFDYENDTCSPFGIAAGLDYYDEDFIESWWFEQLELNLLQQYEADLLDSNYFFKELLEELQKTDWQSKNFITFLFGSLGPSPANEFLFDYNGTTTASSTLEFVFKKEYES